MDIDTDENTKDTRITKAGWNVISVGDNGFDLLQFIIKVKDMGESSQIANIISSMIM